jgi:hypothetical protein
MPSLESPLCRDAFTHLKYNQQLLTNAKPLCHCLPCRKISGSAFTTNLSVPGTNFTFLVGTEKLKSFAVKHPSGITFTIHFCETCATKIYKEGDSDGLKGVFIVQAGTLDLADGEKGMGIKDVKVGAELWIKNRVGWLEERKGAMQCQEFS